MLGVRDDTAARRGMRAPHGDGTKSGQKGGCQSRGARFGIEERQRRQVLMSKVQTKAEEC